MSHDPIPNWQTPPGHDPYEPWVDINTRKSRQTSRAEWIAIALTVFVWIGAAGYSAYVGSVMVKTGQWHQTPAATVLVEVAGKPMWVSEALAAQARVPEQMVGASIVVLVAFVYASRFIRHLRKKRSP